MEVVDSRVPLKLPCQELDLIPDFRIAREVGGSDPTAAKFASRLGFGTIVLGLFAIVHQPGCLPCDLPPEFVGAHIVVLFQRCLDGG